MKLHLYLSLFLILFGCTRQKDSKEEILTVEQAFKELVASEGIASGFVEFADEGAVIVRGDRVIKGKKQIKNYFTEFLYTNVQLDWEPEFVEVAESDDLAYTYGTYTFNAVDTSGQNIHSKGIFHTIWKRQSDGSWKYVYD